MIRTSRMGKTGLNAVLKTELAPEMKESIQQQLQNYDELEQDAVKLAEGRGWKMKNTNPVLAHMIEHMTRMKLGKKDRNSKIARMVIEGNTQGVISSFHDLHRYEGEDHKVVALNRKFIECEKNHIRQMEKFL